MSNCIRKYKLAKEEQDFYEKSICSDSIADVEEHIEEDSLENENIKVTTMVADECCQECPCPVTPIDKVKEYLDKNNAASKAPFSACLFGNAFTNEEVFISSGTGRNGAPLDPNMYWRWASMSKILAGILIAAAIEDGYINSVDEPAYLYLPELANITTYVSDSVSVGGTDQFGTPLFNQVLTSDPDLGKKITIRMLLTFQSGLSYTFWGLGSQRQLFVNSFAGVKSGQNYIAWLQNIENNSTPYADTLTAAYNQIPNTTNTDVILNSISKFPLLNKPGVSSVYDVGYTFIAGLIGGALQKKGILQTAAQYAKLRIFDPLGMESVWLNNGSLNPPIDVLERLEDAFFCRLNTGSSASGSFQKGPNVEYNTVYSVFDPAANGDGLKYQSVEIFTQKETNNYVINDCYAGGFSGAGVGTLSDFCKLLKMLINRGMNKETNTRVLSEQGVDWVLSSQFTISEQTNGIKAPNTGLINILNPSANWAAGTSRFVDGTGKLPFACSPTTYTWGGYYGTTFYFDVKTGNYLVSGTQVSGASWRPTTSISSFQPDAALIWRTLTAM